MNKFTCPCCHEDLWDADPDDAPFCFTCGLYWNDDASKCLRPDHRAAK